MAARILDGRALAAELRDEVAARAQRLRARGIAPRLGVAIVGEDPASRANVRSLEKVGAGAGVEVANEDDHPDQEGDQRHGPEDETHRDEG